MSNSTRKVLSATRKNESASISAIARRAGVSNHTAYMALRLLTVEGLAASVGTKRTGKRGRPAHLFRRVAA